MEKMQFWSNPLEHRFTYGVQLEYRSELAWQLISHFGSIAAKIEGEDAAGRAKLELQSAQELVARCFAIADAFVDTTEERGGLRMETVTPEEKAAYMGNLERIKNDASWKKPEVEKVAKEVLDRK